MQIVTFATLQIPSKLLICPFWFIVPQVVIAVRNSILVGKGTKRVKSSGLFALKPTSSIVTNTRVHI